MYTTHRVRYAMAAGGRREYAMVAVGRREYAMVAVGRREDDSSRYSEEEEEVEAPLAE